jgi:8'-apo-carotenoid 13,14-cleaving dioxygenase
MAAVAERTEAKESEVHPYLSGMHAPMRSEVTLEDLTVTGTIPAGLDGRYIRIGPNPIGAVGPNHHWFVGDGMVHGIRIKDGKALWYKNRWLRSLSVSKALGEDPAPGPRRSFMPGSPLDTVNTNVLGHAGRIWALVEASANPVELGEDLETIAHNPFDETLKGSFTAHPHLDPATGEMHAICYDGPVMDEIRHVVIDAHGKVRREEPIKVVNGPSIHDCMITANHVIIFDLPVTFSLDALMSGASFPYQWNPGHRARVGLLPREGRGEDTIWCDVDPCYVFHPANAFERPDGRVVVDVCVHDRMFDGSRTGPESSATPLERWTIDPVAKSVERVVLDPAPQEFPRPDERRIGQPYRYAFTVSLPDPSSPQTMAPTRIFKHDLEAGTRQVHDFGPFGIPGEFVFVPKADDAREGEGWLMGYVIDMRRQTTDLVILDAENFEGEPVARVHVPHRIPPGFHGNWIAAT